MSRDSKNIAQAKRMLRERGYNNVSDIINRLRNDIPNVRLPKKENKSDVYKFIYALSRMYADGQLSDPKTIFGVNTSLYYAASDEHINEYDRNLNGLSAKELIKRFKSIDTECLSKDKKRSLMQMRKKNDDYNIVKIDSFDKASLYSDYTSWCVTKSKQMYENYTCNKTGLFYFVLKKDFESVEQKHTGDTALDEYGLSMIAVSVKMTGAVNTITCRWNHDNGGNDSVMTVEELEELIGMSFYEAFPPKSKEELRAMGISDKLGTYYKGPAKDGTIVEGIVVEVYPDDRPKTLMSLNWIKNPKDGSINMNWYDAVESVQGPWELGSKELLERIMPWKDIINAGIDDLNERIENGEDITEMYNNKVA